MRDLFGVSFKQNKLKSPHGWCLLTVPIIEGAIESLRLITVGVNKSNRIEYTKIWMDGNTVLYFRQRTNNNDNNNNTATLLKRSQILVKLKGRSVYRVHIKITSTYVL